MKFIFTFLILLFSIQFLQAQNSDPVPDTSTTYQWQNEQFKVNSDIIYLGDWLCNLYDSTLYRNYTGTMWKDSLLDTYIYTFASDSPGIRTGKSFKVTQVMKDGAWINTSRTTYYGYIYGPVATVQEQWVDNDWQPISQDLYTYMNGDFSTVAMHLHQDAILATWRNDYQEINTYDSLKRKTNEITQHWDTTINNWINSSRQLFTYPTKGVLSGTPATDTVQRWVNNNWQMDSLHLYSYDSISNSSTELVQKYIDSNSLWQNRFLLTATYHNSPYYTASDNFITETVYQYWTDSGWQNQKKVVFVRILHDCILPLKLLNFTAYRQNNLAKLAWQTTNEINTLSFAVQRSDDGVHFVTVGQALAKNNNLNDYYYDDNIAAVSAQKLYYRLQITDKNGTAQLSSIATVENKRTLFTASVFTNPIRNNLLVVNIYSLLAANISIAVYDMQGKKIEFEQSHVEQGSSIKSILINRAPAGMYLLRISNGEKTRLLKIVKQ